MMWATDRRFARPILLTTRAKGDASNLGEALYVDMPPIEKPIHPYEVWQGSTGCGRQFWERC